MSNLLDRRAGMDLPSHSFHNFTAGQVKQNQILANFVQEASHWESLLAMMAGGLAYRATKLGVLSVGAPHTGPLRLFAPVLGLASEVTVFRGVNSLLHASLTPHSSWFTDFVNFASLKIFGLASRNTNLVLSHSLQDVGMVAGHQVAYGLNLATRPEGTLFEQLVHAEITNLQMQAGMSLANHITGGRLTRFERSLEVLEQARGSTFGMEKNRDTFQSVLNFSSVLQRIPSGQRRGRAAFYQAEKLREYYVDGVQPFLECLAQQVAQLGTSVKALQIEVWLDEKLETPGGRIVAEIAFQFQKPVERAVLDILRKSHLQEIRMNFPMGNQAIFFRYGKEDAPAAKQEMDACYLGRHEEAPPLSVKAAALEKSRIVFPWLAPAKHYKNVGSYLRDLRNKKGFTQAEAAALLSQQLGYSLTERTLGKYELGHTEEIPLAVLTELARLYQIDVRKIIAVSNRTRFPDLPAEMWSAAKYPFYVEKASDVMRLEYFRDHDPQRKSLGYLLYEFRKNPFQPIEMVRMERLVNYATNAYSDIEFNRIYPDLDRLRIISSLLGKSLEEVLAATNSTWHPDLKLKELFGTEAIYLEPHSDDRAKVLAYQASPGSLGQLLFAWRQQHFMSIDQAADYASIVSIAWHERELNKVDVDTHTLRIWLDLFDQLGLDPAPLYARMESKGKKVVEAGGLLLEAVGSEGLNHFAARAGVCEKHLGAIANGKKGQDTFVDPGYILQVADALPDLERDLFYRDLHKDVSLYFPETEGERPVLYLTEEQLAAALRFRLGDVLFAYRMDHGISQLQMGESLEVNNQTVRWYESMYVQIQNPSVLKKLADQLPVDPRIFYVSARFPVLRMFRIVDPKSEQGRVMTSAEFQRLKEVRDSILRPDNMRDDLYAVMSPRGIKNAGDLERYGVPAGKAKMWLKKVYRLTLEDILLLQKLFPEISYQKLYEHFHHAPLVYFFGTDTQGNIDYHRVGEEDLSSVPQRFEELVREKYGSLYRAGKDSSFSFLGDRDGIRRFFAGRSDEMVIATLARVTGFPKAPLYAYMRRDELAPILNPSSPENLSTTFNHPVR